MKKMILMLPLLFSFSVFANTQKDQKLTVIPALSKIEWKGTKLNGDFHAGDVTIKSGAVTLAGDLIKSGEIIIDMDSMTVTDIPKEKEENGKLLGHLKNEDFFNVKKFNTAKLNIKSSKVVKPSELEVTGDLTIKNITKPVVFTLNLSKQDKKTVAKGKMVVDRTEFDIKYGSKKFFTDLVVNRVINNEFELSFTVLAE